MPQASDKLRTKIKSMFMGNLDDEGPVEFLTAAGYQLKPNWVWTKPGVTELWETTPDEMACICFLQEEWDYGGLDAD